MIFHRFLAKALRIIDRKAQGMKCFITLILLVFSLQMNAQIVQGCPGCPKLYTGEWTDEEYRKMAKAELTLLAKLDHEITSSIRTAWKKLHPQSKIQINTIVEAYTLLALTDSLKITLPLQPDFCEECSKLELSVPMLLDPTTKTKIQTFVKSKFRQTYLSQKYHLNLNEMNIFTTGMTEIAGVK